MKPWMHLAVGSLSFGLAAILLGGCGSPRTAEEKQASALVGQLKDMSPETRAAAARELGRMRYKPAGSRLIRMLDDVRMDVRTAAAEALGEIGEVRAVKPLGAMLETTDWALRKAAVEALGKIATPETVPILAGVLADDNMNMGMSAAAGLVHAGPSGIQALLAAATNEIVRMRRAAAYGFEQAPGAAASEALRNLLHDSASAVRLEAMESLLRREPSEAGPLIVGMVADKDPVVRKRAADLASRMGAPAVATLAELARTNAEDARLEAVRTLCRMDVTQAVVPLLAAMQDKEKVIQEVAAEAVASPKSRAALRPLLVEALGHADVAVRRSASGLLEEDGGKDLLKAALPLLQDPDEATRLSAARIIGRVAEPTVLDRLIPLLQDKSLAVRQAAAAGLIERGDPRAADALIEGLKRNASEGGKSLPDDELALSLEMLGQAKDMRVFDHALALLNHSDGQVAIAAAEALGNIGDHRAIEPLRAVVAVGDINRAVAAGKALVGLQGNDATDAIVKRMNDGFVKSGGYKGSWRNTHVVTLWFPVLAGLRDPRAVDALIPLLRYHRGAYSESAAVYNEQKNCVGIASSVAEVLAGLGDPRAFDPIVERARLSQKEDNRYEPRARRICAEALVKMDAGRAAPIVTELLANEHKHREDLLIHYIGLLRGLGDARAVPAIAAQLVSDSKDVKAAAREALLQFGDAAIPGLLAMLDAAGVGLRSQAAAVLAAMGEPAFAALTETMDKGSEKAKQCAAWALGQMNEPRAAGTLVKGMNDASPRVRAAAVWALGELRAAGGAEALSGTLKNDADRFVREAAVRALGAIGDGRAVEALAGALTETNATIRCAAAVSLGQVGGDGAAEALRRLLAQEQDADARAAAAGALRAIEQRESAPPAARGRGPIPGEQPATEIVTPEGRVP